MTQETQMLLGLFLGILVMIVLVLKTRTHTFIALLLAALITALVWKNVSGRCDHCDSGWIW